MRILIVSDYAYPAGGAEMMVRRMRDGLKARGHDARIFSTDLRNGKGENFADYTCLGTETKFRTLLQTANPWASGALKRVLAEFDPDIVHVRMFLTQLSPLILKHLKGRRAIYHLAWYRAICPTGRKTLPDFSPCRQGWGKACLRNGCVPVQDWPLLMHQMRSAERQLDCFQTIVANSAFVQSVMAASGVRSEMIHNGVPITEPVQTEARAAHPVVLFAGRLTPEKGCQVLIEAFAKVADRRSDAELVVAGEGPYRPELEALAARQGLQGRVRFLGRLNQDDLRAQTQRAWLQVVPSVWDEPFGIAALDAMAQARAVIASRAGGLSEIVDDGATGFLVPPSDPVALAQRLTALIEDPDGCAAMGAAGRQRLVEHFSMDRCVDAFTALYHRLLSAPQG
jgi:glycosyltransferase involved in cell wall biosynthesis